MNDLNINHYNFSRFRTAEFKGVAMHIFSSTGQQVLVHDKATCLNQVDI